MEKKTHQEFHFRDGSLYCERVPLRRIARQVGTPCYVYSQAALRGNATCFQESFRELDPLICFAVKANHNLAVLKTFVEQGLGFDIVSGGELHRLMRCGADPAKIVYSGVGKTTEEMEQALTRNIRLFNVESYQELETLRGCARRLHTVASVAIRVNPDIEITSHPYIRTGANHHKFGISLSEVPALANRLQRMKGLRFEGIACHIGSQVTDLKPFDSAFAVMLRLYKELLALGVPLRYINLGGGLGVSYGPETPPGAAEYARLVKTHFQGCGARIILEPGRFMMRDSGVLVTRVLYTKTAGEKTFYIVDGGMNDLIRPTLYQAHHEIQPLTLGRGRLQTVDVVGPVCETGDFLARDRELPPCHPGDYLAVMQAGAYCHVQSSNYNARLRSPEILVTGGKFSIVRRRETHADLVRGETLV